MRFLARLRPLVTGALLVSGLVVVLSTTTAQQPSPSPSPGPEAGLAFPIPELGSCSDLGSCATYCEDPVNHASCVAYAKEKGFYEDDPTPAAPEAFWEKVKGALGCDSREACETYCAEPGNQTACHDLAVREKIPGGFLIDPQKDSILAAAQTTLGCDSYEACRTLCANPANAGQCTAFANQVGLRGGETTSGPGGCATTESCQLYCSDPNNFADCNEAVGGSFRGPGGSTTVQAARAYCEENPDGCRAYGVGTNGVYVPVTCPAGGELGPGGVCTPADQIQEAGECTQGGDFWNGQACADAPPPGITLAGTGYFEPRKDMGGCATPAACYDYCVGSPGACSGFTPDRPRPPDVYHPTVYYTPGTPVKYEPRPEFGGCASPGSCYDFCTENPATCQGFDPKSPRPADVYVPGTYYTPPVDVPYFTPSSVNFYVTPMYYTPGGDARYATPSYYTPGMYSTPQYYTPGPGDYTTPNYYTPGGFYTTPTGTYPTPTYTTPQYYTPPIWSNYTTPTYYTPPVYVTPSYYTPSDRTYTTPTYLTPTPYTSPAYYSPPGILTGIQYSTPTYYTPPKDSNYTTPSYVSPAYYTPGGYYTPTYYTPFGSYSTPAYYSPGGNYTTPTYYTPPEGSNYTTPSYPTPQYYSPSYSTPSYYTPPPGSTYTSPTYYTPYTTPTGYLTPPAYYTPPEGSTYTSPYYTPPYSDSYPTPTAYVTPGAYAYPTPSATTYPTPTTTYAYPTPSYSYPSPESYPTPYSYPTPTDSYPTPTEYPSPYAYPTPGEVHGAGSTRVNIFLELLRFLGFR